MSKGFTHLHNHTSYSQLDGAAKIPEFVGQAVANGDTALGITDHGHMNGVIDFYRECKKQGINPVIGTEGYFAMDRLTKTKGTKRYHITLLAENNEGYQNLMKVSTDAFLKGFYTKPRTDYDFLSQHSKGLIATTGCLGGVVLQHLLNDDLDGGIREAAKLQDIFGKDNLFVEIMNHGIPDQMRTNPLLMHVAKTIDAPLLVTNDCHYTHAADAIPHDVLLCCQTGAQQHDTDRFKFESDQHYLKTAEEMRYLFSEVEVGCDNTMWIAERANVEIDFDTLHLPSFPVPDGFHDDFEFLEKLTMEAMTKRFGQEPSQDYVERARYELSVIKNMNLSSYFLIFWDLAAFAKRERIFTGPGRGSAAGSLVSYLLGITKLDPLKHGLIFERFLNPDRIALADVDWDIDTRYREKLIAYTREKYGQEHVAQIITFTTIGARTAVRDAARVLGFTHKKGDEVAKLMPPLIMGVPTPLWACFRKEAKYEAGYKNAQGLRDLYKIDPDAKKIIDAAMGIEGLIKTNGVHAAGVVIGDRPLVELVPLQYGKPEKGKPVETAPIITQYEKQTIEDLGLLKMDFLGLRNLDVISDTLLLIGEDMDFFDDLPLDDPLTFQILQQGHTIGVFQVESPQMRALLRRMKPTDTDDISAVLALYRPGPMAENMHNDYADRKNLRQGAVPFHEDAAEILGETYQLAVYQEQVMTISNKFAGYTMSEADNLRKIMGKKLPDKMAAEKDKFVSGCIALGYTPEFSDRLFTMIEGFASYGFNKSHSYSYGYITYWTAYLKAHYPREYMACLCNSVMDDFDKSAMYLNEVRRMGLTVDPPDVNLSDVGYTVTDTGVRIGLALLRSVGLGLSATIASEAPYVGVYDFAKRVMPDVSAFRSLAASGALGAFGTRQGIHSVADNILGSIRKQNKKNNTLQGGLFDETPEIMEDMVNVTVPEVEWGWHDLLDMEKEAIGLYISGHPLDDYREKAADYTIADMKEIEPPQKRSEKVLCIVSDVNVKYTKKGDTMAVVVLEDQTGSLESVIFPKKWAEVKDVVKENAVIYAFLRPDTDMRDEKNYVFGGADALESHKVDVDATQEFGIYVPKGFHRNESYLSKLKGILLSYKGNVPVSVYVSRSSVVDMKNEYSIRPSEGLKTAIHGLFKEFAAEM